MQLKKIIQLDSRNLEHQAKLAYPDEPAVISKWDRVRLIAGIPFVIPYYLYLVVTAILTRIAVKGER